MSNKGLESLIRSSKYDEYHLKDLLRENNFNVPNHILIDPDIRAKPENIKYPAALKVVDINMLHKSEKGGVKLWIQDWDEAVVEIKKMKTRFPKSSLMLEEMFLAGVETIVGVAEDSQFGHFLMFGTGGIYAELFGDVSFRSVPLDRNDAEEMIEETSLSKFIEGGFRNIKVDHECVVSFLLNISRFVEQNKELISQLDLNPVMFNGSISTILDAKLIPRKTGGI
jgi:hypothetical protein